ncbi:hypothetical protein VTN00DRAFT_6904 [Thermoascus crustaceus]|uniref:uncharacterized protein n=1 Tax=Thermoascus crustaceus TaxID=5088 RepID=UPI0037420E7C
MRMTVVCRGVGIAQTEETLPPRPEPGWGGRAWGRAGWLPIVVDRDAARAMVVRGFQTSAQAVGGGGGAGLAVGLSILPLGVAVEFEERTFGVAGALTYAPIYLGKPRTGHAHLSFTGHQARALAGALYAYAANIDNLDALTPSTKLITHRHSSFYIQPDDYKTVGEYLLAAVKQVLGNVCTPAILNAWTAAYWQLANILINKEADLYRQSEDWTYWRKFKIVKKVPESDDITSFYLAPVDGKRPRPDHDMTHPVVLLPAGVGLTPLLSMLNTLTSWPARAFKDHVRSLADEHENLKVTFFASSPAQHEQRGIDFHRDGQVDLQKLD